MNNISIIIPHKNSGDLLGRLLRSIPIEKGIQIIVVDDQSTIDERKKVLNLLKTFDFEFHINESFFAGGARNTGLKYATGKWVLFADADDYYEPDFLSLVNKYKESDVDIVFFNVTSRYTEDNSPAYRDKHVKTIAQKAIDKGDMNYLRCCYTAPWGKLIKRSLIEDRQIRFDEVIAGNDMMFSVMSGVFARQVIYESTPLYCITVTPNSITNVLSKERFESKFQATLRTNKFLRNQKKSSYQVSILYFLAGAYQFGWRYQMHVIKECILHRSNLFVGMSKVLKLGSTMQNRQNHKIIKDERGK